MAFTEALTVGNRTFEIVELSEQESSQEYTQRYPQSNAAPRVLSLGNPGWELKFYITVTQNGSEKKYEANYGDSSYRWFVNEYKNTSKQLFGGHGSITLDTLKEAIRANANKF